MKPSEEPDSAYSQHAGIIFRAMIKQNPMQSERCISRLASSHR